MSATPTGIDNTWTVTPPTGVSVIGVAGSDLYGNPGTATYATSTYTLTVDTVGSGSVTKNPEQASYNYGDVVELTAVPVDGWSFSSWSGSLSGSASPSSLTVTGDMSVTATFIQGGYSLMVSTVGSGSVAKVPDQASYHLGNSVELTATPAAGWSFSGWSGDLTGSTNPATLAIDADPSVTATFIRNEYSLTVTLVGNGHIDLDNVGPYYYGDVVELTAVPVDGWSFSSWSGSLSGSASPSSLTVTGDMSVTATFIQLTVYGIFGNEEGASYTDVRSLLNMPHGSHFVCDETGILQSISVYMYASPGSTVQCAIYTRDSALSGTLVAVSEQKTFPQPPQTTIGKHLR